MLLFISLDLNLSNFDEEIVALLEILRVVRGVSQSYFLLKPKIKPTLYMLTTCTSLYVS